MQDCSLEVETGNREMGDYSNPGKALRGPNLTGKVGTKKGEVQMGFKRENQQDLLTN